MSNSESWENECCRCGSDIQENPRPGKRACHITCGSCLYPDNPHCVSCEMVTHCEYALKYLRSLKPNGIKKGCYFAEQLSGDETLYHTLQFVNASSNLLNGMGEKEYMRYLTKKNSKSICFHHEAK
jgi:hypothetical protein